MKLHSKVFFFVLVVLVTACSLVFAEEEPKRNAILKRSASRAPKTTTTTLAPESSDYENDEYINEGEGDAVDDTSTSTTTSTEAPKRALKPVRPADLTNDFLTSLRLRQQNAKKALKERAIGQVSKTEEPKSNDDKESESAPAPAPAPVSQSKFKGNSALSRRKPSKPVKAEIEEDADQGEESAPTPSPAGRRPGRLGLKPRN